MPPSEANYDEAKVPSYTLPDPLILASGEPVADAATWTEMHRVRCHRGDGIYYILER